MPQPERVFPHYPYSEQIKEAHFAIDLSVLPKPDELVSQAKKLWQIETIPTPPTELLQTLERARNEGFFGFVPVYYRDIKFTKDSELPGRGIKPTDWLWDNIAFEISSSSSETKEFWEKEEKLYLETGDIAHCKSFCEAMEVYDGVGGIDEEVAHLHQMWALIDSTQPPNYYEGLQMYENDSRLGSVLRDLREIGKIGKMAYNYEVKEQIMPLDSRFGLTWDEINEVVIHEVADILIIDPSRISLPRIIEYNIAGNLYLPKFGTTDTSVFLADKQYAPLIGGNSLGRIMHLKGIRHPEGTHIDEYQVLDDTFQGAGLANISWAGSMEFERSDHVGFGLQINFPIKSV